MNDDFSDAKFSDVTRVLSAAAFEKEDALAVLFETKEDGKVGFVVPAAIVGPLLVAIRDGYKPLSRSGGLEQDIFVPMGLTGARAFEAGKTGDPALLLQLDGKFELALLVNDSSLDALEAVI